MKSYRIAPSLVFWFSDFIIHRKGGYAILLCFKSCKVLYREKDSLLQGEIVMMKKDTEELEHEIEKAKAVEHYLEENRHELRDMSLAVFLQGLLEEKQLKKADVIRRTGMEPTYGYHIFDGHKKHPARSKVLLLALAMRLTVKEAQHLLYYAGCEALYARNSFDSIIWYALEHHLNVIDANLLLERLGEKPLA